MPTREEDSSELKRLTETLIRVLNAQDFDYKSADGQEFINHLASDFEARFDNYPHSLSFKEQTEIWRQDARDYPELQFSVLEMTAKVQRRSQTASVYLRLALTGMSDIKFQGSCELRWKYCEGRWLLYYHVSMRGLL